MCLVGRQTLLIQHVPDMTYNVFGGMLNLAHPTFQSILCYHLSLRYSSVFRCFVVTLSAQICIVPILHS